MPRWRGFDPQPGCRLLRSCSPCSWSFDPALSTAWPRCSATPARVLTSIPHVGVVRASNYGGAVGDIDSKLSESAGKRRGGLAISRTGKVVARGHPGAGQVPAPRPSRLRSLRPADEGSRQAGWGDSVRFRAPGQPAGVRHDAGSEPVRAEKVAKSKGADGALSRHEVDKLGPCPVKWWSFTIASSPIKRSPLEALSVSHLPPVCRSAPWMQH